MDMTTRSAPGTQMISARRRRPPSIASATASAVVASGAAGETGRHLRPYEAGPHGHDMHPAAV